MFPEALMSQAETLLAGLRAQKLLLATAESCTGGLIAALMTELPGSSDVIDRCFVTYTNEAKIEMLGVPAALIAAHGAVSREVAHAMADGALRHSRASVAVACTGVAGPGGGTHQKPVGLVHLVAERGNLPPLHMECRFGDIGRAEIRLKAVAEALELVRRVIVISY